MPKQKERELRSKDMNKFIKVKLHNKVFDKNKYLWVNVKQIAFIEEINEFDSAYHYGIIGINGMNIDIELSSFYELLRVLNLEDYYEKL